MVYLGAYVPEADIRSLSDIVEPPVRAKLKQLQDKYNNGEPFPTVAAMPTGKPRRKA